MKVNYVIANRRYPTKQYAQEVSRETTRMEDAIQKLYTHRDTAYWMGSLGNENGVMRVFSSSFLLSQLYRVRSIITR